MWTLPYDHTVRPGQTLWPEMKTNSNYEYTLKTSLKEREWSLSSTLKTVKIYKKKINRALTGVHFEVHFEVT